MIVSGHQPAYLPWLGYFHKLSLCDTFVYMDTVQYLENDWNNRNKIRIPDGTMWLTVPIDRRKTTGKLLDQIVIKGHDTPESKDYWAMQHWKSIENNYANAPFFKMYEKQIKSLYLDTVWVRLIDLCWSQFVLFADLLGIKDKKIVRMSEVQFQGEKDQLVADHCRKLGATEVVFGKHGRDYVNLDIFSQMNVKVYFQEYLHPTYKQRFRGFESNLSIIDLLFNHGPESFSILQSGNVSYADLIEKQLWEKTS